MKETQNIITCFHCGNDCQNEKIATDNKVFCCNGCKMVYEILNENDLCAYYDLNEHPGIDRSITARKDKFAFLDQKEIKEKLIQYTNGKQTQLSLYLPQIHCSSCLYLLENVFVLNKGISQSKINFTKKEIFISYDESITSLRKVIETLTDIGYEPHLSLNDVANKSKNTIDRTRWYKIGVAGFCFGNIMMMSFADYFATNSVVDYKIQLFFKVVSVLLSLPVLFYAGAEFFISAFKSLQNKYLNLDLPVALALIITFVRSLYEIFNGSGNGYLDSMSGIVFFMLIGRWFQSRTYQSISFDRDYKSFFPIAINVISDGKIIPTQIEKVKVNDIIQIHSNEIIPVDAILSKGIANIDYSFVSGESEPVKRNIGEIIYAGGKQRDGLLELIVAKEISQSYITNLWNNPIFHNEKKYKTQNVFDTIGKYFTYAVLVIGIISGLYWYMQVEYGKMWNSITTVLIVACPCALLLSKNYTQGNLLRIFAKQQFYVRNADIIEKFNHIDHIVLDKTGTLTQTNLAKVRYIGYQLDVSMQVLIASLLQHSSHPNSKAVLDFLNIDGFITVQNFKEIEGRGIEGWVNEIHIKIGSADFIGASYSDTTNGTKVVIKIDNEVIGEFILSNKYRFGVSKLIKSLQTHYSLSLLSGDNDAEAKNIEKLFGIESDVYFNQSPQQKLDYIKELKHKNYLNVLMIGDGLNDAGALKQSNIGIAVADDSNTFTPACDAIINGKRLPDLYKFLQFAKLGKKIILFTFAFSAIYNIIGLSFAVQGVLSPVIAAILMPLSSITIILFSYGLVLLFAKKYFPNKKNM